MDWNRVEGNWKQVKGAVKQQWGKLIDNDLTQIDGSREKLEGIIQERYGIARDETRKQIDAWYQQQVGNKRLGRRAPAETPGLFLLFCRADVPWPKPKSRGAIEEREG